MKGGIGLDISNGAVTVALLRGTKNFFLDTVVQEKITAPGEDETEKQVVSRLLRDIWEKHELQSYPVVASLEAKDCILRQLVVPFAQEEKINKTIKFEAEKYLHACSIEDVIVDFIKVDDLDGKSGILLTAGQKHLISGYLQQLREGGVDPESLDLDVVALFNAFCASPQYRPEGTVMVIDIGTEAVRMLLVVDGRLKRVRSFRIRAEELPELRDGPDRSLPVSGDIDAFEDDLEERFAAIDHELEKAGEQISSRDEDTDADDIDEDVPIAVLGDEEFDQLKDTEETVPEEGEDSGDKSSEITSPPVASRDEESHSGGSGGASRLLERILVEAQRTFASVIFTKGLDAICVTGVGSRKEGVNGFFREHFEKEVEYIDVRGFSAEDTAIEEAELLSERGCVALGLALRAVEQDGLSVDFRREEFRFERRYERLKLPLLFTGLLLFFSIFLHSLFLYREKEEQKESYYNMLQHQALLFNKTFKKDPLKHLVKGRSITSLLDKEEEKLKEFRGKGRGVMPDYLGMLEVLGDLSGAVDKSGVPNLIWVKVDVRPEIPKKKTYSAGRVGILADDSASVSRIKEAINRHSTYFTAIKPMTSQHKASGRILCQMSLQYKDHVFQKDKTASGSGNRRIASREAPGGSRRRSY